MRPTPRAGQFPCTFVLRLSIEQKKGLEKAIACSPGCASPSGVARKAIDEYLDRILSQAPA